MESDYQTAARNYELWGYGYAQKLADVQAKNELLLTEQLCSLFHAHLTYYKHVRVPPLCHSFSVLNFLLLLNVICYF